MKLDCMMIVFIAVQRTGKDFVMLVKDGRTKKDTTKLQGFYSVRKACAISTNPVERKIIMKMKVMLDPGAKMPTRAHEHDVGFDLYSREDVMILERGNHKFDTGVHIAIPVGYAGMIKSKSGLNVNENITSDGVIDPDYTGSICVKLYNNGDRAVRIREGQKISQLVIVPVITPELKLTDSMEATARGDKGFGSSGKY